MKPLFRPPCAHRRRAVFRWLQIPIVCAFAILARADDFPPLRSPSILLRAADTTVKGSLPPTKAAVLAEAGIRSELLVRYGRLLPDTLSQESLKKLAALLQSAEDSDATTLEAALETFPRADELTFDGQRYAGANLSYIDTLLGKSKRPIAFDRALPALLVPLSPEAETALLEKRTAFQASAESREARDSAGQAFGEGAGLAMFADGQYLRPYVGRFDDLYFHLFQNGNGASALAFSGLVDGLGERTYQPVHGLARKKTLPAAPFDLNDILSDGGKSAVQRYLPSDRRTEPFKAFAFRILPNVIAKVRSVPVGGRFTVSQAEMIQALRASQHFYPTQVPPLYRSPDRFLGWAGLCLIPVASKNPELPPGAADSWYPLPRRAGRAPAESAADGAASAKLFESSSTVDMVWEDPQLSNLLADPDAHPAPRKGAVAQSPALPAAPAPGPGNPNPASDPRLRPAVTRPIAVITPTAAEAAEYLVGIAGSDEQIRQIEQTRGRIRLLRGFIESARSAFPANTANERHAPVLSDDLQRAITADLTSFDQQDTELDARLREALQQRADLRSTLADRLIRDRVRPLEALGKKPAPAADEPKPGAALNL